ncbi:putative Ku family DNA helicase [Aureobasidium pullulans]|uniref:ATP-dependent DNA helicase II subunit 2 n=1 Tax=Aureobasidium pullulans TaxID=5580 RepID=A0A4V4K0T3_AURPU|nr:putative Ku family DNA helicase [Aureobasidium pullulans]THY46023.1 putative Ku family DNA helicase [Aureobasidium pullulans]TIA44505.1 putative Ku family DNA helicase [Aureobasidium pullulans]TIA82713.1 putative Ku family DNA helicase [Aureobasidium pullulans]
MAGKEATVYIVDLGEPMGEKHNGREITDLDWALTYIWDKITTTVATERKTAMLAVVGLRTDDIRRLKQQLVPSSTDVGDVVAIHMIETVTRKLAYTRKIVLVTNGNGSIDTDGLDLITSKCKEDGIELVILGVDFDDAEYGFKEENKDPTKAPEECNGLYGTLGFAIDEMVIPRMKTVRPVHSYKGYLTLGDMENYDSAMAIDVERYPRVMIAKAPSASQFVVRPNMAAGETQSQFAPPDDQPKQGDLAAVKNTRTYQVPDEEAPGGKRELEQEELARGFSYGSTVVPIEESDKNVMDFESKQGMDIIGFVVKDQYERYLDMSKSHVIIAERTNEKAIMALSSFIRALYELETYAVARLVPKQGKSPTMVLLAPSVDADAECLFEVELPFAEDLRSYRFPALDKIVTVSGKELKQHRFLPSDDLMDAMSDYVDAMDLSKFGEDEEGNPSEYAPIEDTFSPALHRVSHVIRSRAIHPDEKLPPISEILIKYSKPPQELVEGATASLKAITAAADSKSKRGRRDAPKPLSGLDVTALLSNPSGTIKLSPQNAIPEFRQVLDGGKLEEAEPAFQQLGKIIRDFIKNSVGGSGYARALEAMRVMREEASDLEIPDVYNDFVRNLKTAILKEELNGDRKDMWFMIRANRMGLIQSKECGSSEIKEDEAKEFLTVRLSV